MRSLYLSTVSLITLFATAAAAEAPVDEILVTARGRTEILQDIPDSVTVLSRDDLRLREVRTIDDVLALTPGVHMVNDQDPGTNIVTVRGITTDRLQAPSIAYVIDGVSLADTEFFTGRFFDMERVEILKGPQGALYGKNAIGGVINVTTRAPSAEWEGNAEIGYGNGDTVELEGGIGGPIIADKLLFRVAGAFHETDGFIHNRFLDRKVDHFTSRNLRARFLGLLGENFTADLRFNYMNEEGGAAYISSNNVTGLHHGRLSGAALTDPIGDFEGAADREWKNLSLKLDWGIGGGTLTSISAYDDYHKDFVEEFDFRNGPVTLDGLPLFPEGVQPLRQPKDIEVLTQEIRYTSDDDRRFRFILGAFVQDMKNVRIDDFGPLLFGAEAPRFRTRSTQWAAFGQASYDITPTLELTAALRYDRDDRAVTTTGNDSGALVERREEVFDRVQPKLSLAWQVTDDHMLYATYSEGFKTGGFNAPPGPGDIHEAVFRPEKTRSYELGAKTSWFGGRLVANLAAFHTKYDNLQYFAFIGANSLAFNADRADIWGLEFAAVARPIDNLTLDMSFALTDSEIEELTAPDPVNPAIFVDYAGRNTPNNPRNSFNLGAQYEWPVDDRARVVLRADWRHLGKIYYEIDNVLHSPGRDTLDARIAYETPGWSIALWGKNLTDERWAISAFGQGQVAFLAGLGPDGPFDSFTINRGRQYGATLGLRF